MRSNTLAAFLLMLVCLAAGLAFLFFSVPERGVTTNVAVTPTCVGLMPPDEFDVSLRGTVTRVTAHLAADFTGYIDIYVSIDDFELGSRAATRSGVPGDFAARGSVENMVILQRPKEPLPLVSEGDCLLASVRFGRWACGPACDAIGYVVGANRVLN